MPRRGNRPASSKDENPKKVIQTRQTRQVNVSNSKTQSSLKKRKSEDNLQEGKNKRIKISKDEINVISRVKVLAGTASKPSQPLVKEASKSIVLKQASTSNKTLKRKGINNSEKESQKKSCPINDSNEPLKRKILSRETTQTKEEQKSNQSKSKELSKNKKDKPQRQKKVLDKSKNEELKTDKTQNMEKVKVVESKRNIKTKKPEGKLSPKKSEVKKRKLRSSGNTDSVKEVCEGSLHGETLDVGKINKGKLQKTLTTPVFSPLLLRSRRVVSKIVPIRKNVGNETPKQISELVSEVSQINKKNTKRRKELKLTPATKPQTPVQHINVRNQIRRAATASARRSLAQKRLQIKKNEPKKKPVKKKTCQSTDDTHTTIRTTRRSSDKSKECNDLGNVESKSPVNKKDIKYQFICKTCKREYDTEIECKRHELSNSQSCGSSSWSKIYVNSSKSTVHVSAEIHSTNENSVIKEDHNESGLKSLASCEGNSPEAGLNATQSINKYSTGTTPCLTKQDQNYHDTNYCTVNDIELNNSEETYMCTKISEVTAIIHSKNENSLIVENDDYDSKSLVLCKINCADNLDSTQTIDNNEISTTDTTPCSITKKMSPDDIPNKAVQLFAENSSKDENKIKLCTLVSDFQKNNCDKNLGNGNGTKCKNSESTKFNTNLKNNELEIQFKNLNESNTSKCEIGIERDHSRNEIPVEDSYMSDNGQTLDSQIINTETKNSRSFEGVASTKVDICIKDMGNEPLDNYSYKDVDTKPLLSDVNIFENGNISAVEIEKTPHTMEAKEETSPIKAEEISTSDSKITNISTVLDSLQTPLPKSPSEMNVSTNYSKATTQNVNKSEELNTSLILVEETPCSSASASNNSNISLVLSEKTLSLVDFQKMNDSISLEGRHSAVTPLKKLNISEVSVEESPLSVRIVPRVIDISIVPSQEICLNSSVSNETDIPLKTNISSVATQEMSSVENTLKENDISVILPEETPFVGVNSPYATNKSSLITLTEETIPMVEAKSKRMDVSLGITSCEPFVTSNETNMTVKTTTETLLLVEENSKGKNVSVISLEESPSLVDSDSKKVDVSLISSEKPSFSCNLSLVQDDSKDIHTSISEETPSSNETVMIEKNISFVSEGNCLTAANFIEANISTVSNIESLLHVEDVLNSTPGASNETDNSKQIDVTCEETPLSVEAPLKENDISIISSHATCLDDSRMTDSNFSIMSAKERSLFEDVSKSDISIISTENALHLTDSILNTSKLFMETRAEISFKDEDSIAIEPSKPPCLDPTISKPTNKVLTEEISPVTNIELKETNSCIPLLEETTKETDSSFISSEKSLTLSVGTPKGSNISTVPIKEISSSKTPLKNINILITSNTDEIKTEVGLKQTVVLKIQPKETSNLSDSVLNKSSAYIVKENESVIDATSNQKDISMMDWEEIPSEDMLNDSNTTKGDTENIFGSKKSLIEENQFLKGTTSLIETDSKHNDISLMDWEEIPIKDTFKEDNITITQSEENRVITENIFHTQIFSETKPQESNICIIKTHEISSSFTEIPETTNKFKFEQTNSLEESQKKEYYFSTESKLPGIDGSFSKDKHLTTSESPRSGCLNPSDLEDVDNSINESDIFKKKDNESMFVNTQFNYSDISEIEPNEEKSLNDQINISSIDQSLNLDLLVADNTYSEVSESKDQSLNIDSSVIDNTCSEVSESKDQSLNINSSVTDNTCSEVSESKDQSLNIESSTTDEMCSAKSRSDDTGEIDSFIEFVSKTKENSPTRTFSNSKIAKEKELIDLMENSTSVEESHKIKEGSISSDNTIYNSISSNTSTLSNDFFFLNNSSIDDLQFEKSNNVENQSKSDIDSDCKVINVIKEDITNGSSDSEKEMKKLVNKDSNILSQKMQNQSTDCVNQFITPKEDKDLCSDFKENFTCKEKTHIANESNTLLGNLEELER